MLGSNLLRDNADVRQKSQSMDCIQTQSIDIFREPYAFKNPDFWTNPLRQ